MRFAPDDPASIEPVREGRTDFSGAYATRGITPGRYTAPATAPGKTPATLAVTIVAHEGADETTVVE